MKRLIVNADDLGADEERNRGIFEAARAGVVKSVSLLANGPALGHALDGLRSLNVSVGAHVNLTEGASLSSSPGPLFQGKAETHKRLLGETGLDATVGEEADRQIRALVSAGVCLTHVDGHQHVHVFPAALRAVINAALKNGIRRMRIPDESPDFAQVVPDALLSEGLFFGRLGRDAREIARRQGIVSPEHFRGLFLKGRLTMETLLDTIERLPEGTTELMVHPGRPAARQGGPFGSFSTRDRERELEALLDPRFRQALDQNGIELISYAEIAI